MLDFLFHVTNKPEYKKVRPQNKKFLQIAKVPKDDTKLLLQISFLIESSLIFTVFLTTFQGEGPLICILYPELQMMLFTLMLRFLKVEVVNYKVLKALLGIDVRDEGKQLPFESMNVGVDVKTLLKKCSKDYKKQYRRRCKRFLSKQQHTFNQGC